MVKTNYSLKKTKTKTNKTNKTNKNICCICSQNKKNLKVDWRIIFQWKGRVESAIKIQRSCSITIDSAPMMERESTNVETSVQVTTLQNFTLTQFKKKGAWVPSGIYISRNSRPHMVGYRTYLEFCWRTYFFWLTSTNDGGATLDSEPKSSII